MPFAEQAILLSGGLGTRLRGMFPDLPKALVPIVGKPIIERQVRWLHSLGVNRIHIAAGFMATAIETWFQQNDLSPIEVTFSRETKPLGTAGAVKFAVDHTRHVTHYLVLNGDSLLPNLSLKDLCSPENIHEHLMTMAVTEINDASRYGTVTMDSRGNASAFLEKNHVQGTAWVNGGVYYMNREILDMIPPDTACSLEKEIFPELAKTGKLKCVPCAEPLLDMGTPEGYDAMTKFLIHHLNLNS